MPKYIPRLEQRPRSENECDEPIGQITFGFEPLAPRVTASKHRSSSYSPLTRTRGRNSRRQTGFERFVTERHGARSLSALEGRPRTLYVDAEFEAAIREWLAIRPDPVSSAEPLFLDTGGSWGQRIEPPEVRYVVERHARRHGWYRTGGGATENVTPHYFRHFFTTHLRERTGDRGIVKYLRGDVADDIIDTYTHNWGDQVRETYEANIYSLEL